MIVRGRSAPVAGLLVAAAAMLAMAWAAPAPASVEKAAKKASAAGPPSAAEFAPRGPPSGPPDAEALGLLLLEELRARQAARPRVAGRVPTMTKVNKGATDKAYSDYDWATSPHIAIWGDWATLGEGYALNTASLGGGPAAPTCTAGQSQGNPYPHFASGQYDCVVGSYASSSVPFAETVDGALLDNCEWNYYAPTSCYRDKVNGQCPSGFWDPCEVPSVAACMCEGVYSVDIAPAAGAILPGKKCVASVPPPNCGASDLLNEYTDVTVSIDNPMGIIAVASPTIYDIYAAWDACRSSGQQTCDERAKWPLVDYILRAVASQLDDVYDSVWVSVDGLTSFGIYENTKNSGWPSQANTPAGALPSLMSVSYIPSMPDRSGVDTTNSYMFHELAHTWGFHGNLRYIADATATSSAPVGELAHWGLVVNANPGQLGGYSRAVCQGAGSTDVDLSITSPRTESQLISDGCTRHTNANYGNAPYWKVHLYCDSGACNRAGTAGGDALHEMSLFEKLMAGTMTAAEVSAAAPGAHLLFCEMEDCVFSSTNACSRYPETVTNAQGRLEEHYWCKALHWITPADFVARTSGTRTDQQLSASTFADRSGAKLRVPQVVLYRTAADIPDLSSCPGDIESDYAITRGGAASSRRPSQCGTSKDQKGMFYKRYMPTVQGDINAGLSKVGTSDTTVYADVFPRCADVTGNTAAACADSCHGVPIDLSTVLGSAVTGGVLASSSCEVTGSQTTCALACAPGYAASGSGWVYCDVPSDDNQLRHFFGGSLQCTQTCASVTCPHGKSHTVLAGSNSCPGGTCSVSTCCEEINGCADSPCNLGGDNDATCADVVVTDPTVDPKDHTCTCSTGFYPQNDNAKECGKGYNMAELVNLGGTSARKQQPTSSAFTSVTDLPRSVISMSGSFSVASCVSYEQTGYLFGTYPAESPADTCVGLKLFNDGNMQFRFGSPVTHTANVNLAIRGFAAGAYQRVLLVFDALAAAGPTAKFYAFHADESHLVHTEVLPDAGTSSAAQFFCGADSTTVQLAIGGRFDGTANDPLYPGQIAPAGQGIGDFHLYTYPLDQLNDDFNYLPDCPVPAPVVDGSSGEVVSMTTLYGDELDSATPVTANVRRMPSPFPSTATVTLAFHMKPPSVTEIEMDHVNVGSACFRIYAYSGTWYIMGPAGFASFDTYTLPTMPTDSWSLVQMEFTAAGNTLYIDGAAVGTAGTNVKRDDLATCSDQTPALQGNLYNVAFCGGPRADCEPAPQPTPMPNPVVLLADTITTQAGGAGAITSGTSLQAFDNGATGSFLTMSWCFKAQRVGARYRTGYMVYNKVAGISSTPCMTISSNHDGIALRFPQTLGFRGLMLRTTRIDDGEWHSIAVLVNGSSIDVYVDEVLERAGVYVPPGALVSCPDGDLLFGKRPGHYAYGFTGQLAKFTTRLYNPATRMTPPSGEGAAFDNVQEDVTDPGFYSCPVDPSPAPSTSATPSAAPSQSPPAADACVDFTPTQMRGATGSPAEIAPADLAAANQHMSVCDRRDLHTRCVELVNLYRADDVGHRFSSGVSNGATVGSALGRSLAPLAERTYRESGNECSSSAAIGTALAGSCSAGSRGVPCMQGAGDVTVCGQGAVQQTYQSYAAAAGEMETLIQAMWDAGRNDETEAGFAAMTTEAGGSELSCGLAWDADGRLTLHLDVYEPANPSPTQAFCQPNCIDCGDADLPSSCPEAARPCVCRQQTTMGLYVEVLAMGIPYGSPYRQTVGVAVRDRMSAALVNRVVEFSGCLAGTWSLAVGSSSGGTTTLAAVAGTECTLYTIRTVVSCSAADLYCSASGSNCGASGVDRIENEKGELVFATGFQHDGMLGCHNTNSPFTVTQSSFTSAAGQNNGIGAGAGIRDVLLRYKVQVVEERDGIATAQAATARQTIFSELQTIENYVMGSVDTGSPAALQGLAIMYTATMPSTATVIVGADVEVDAANGGAFPPLDVGGQLPEVSSSGAGMSYASCVKLNEGSTTITIFGNSLLDAATMAYTACFQLKYMAARRLRLISPGAGSQCHSDQLSATALSGGVFHRVVVTADANDITFYVDGQPVGTRSAAQGADVATCPSGYALVGAEPFLYYPQYNMPGYQSTMTGSASEVVFYTEALTAAEVADLPACGESSDGSGNRGDGDDSSGTWIGLSCGASFIIAVTGYCYAKIRGADKKTTSDVKKTTRIDLIKKIDPSVRTTELWQKTSTELDQQTADMYTEKIQNEFPESVRELEHARTTEDVVGIYTRASSAIEQPRSQPTLQPADSKVFV